MSVLIHKSPEMKKRHNKLKKIYSLKMNKIMKIRGTTQTSEDAETCKRGSDQN